MTVESIQQYWHGRRTSIRHWVRMTLWLASGLILLWLGGIARPTPCQGASLPENGSPPSARASRGQQNNRGEQNSRGQQNSRGEHRGPSEKPGFTTATDALEQDATDSDSPDELLDMSLEELMDVEVTSVSKKREKWFESAAAVYVITQEDIRRSGATSIPELLRGAPGVDVARLNSNRWAISIRGFNRLYGDKLLVLIDGRTVYTPTFAGVYWEMQNVPLEDIDRIEIIRGPGGTLWGANAVNGVINIITKNAADTQGLLISGGAGTYERGFGTVRYGTPAGKDAHLRVYGHYFNRDENYDPLNHRQGSDDWAMSQGGVRLDWALSEENDLTLQGDVYEGYASSREQLPLFSPPYSMLLDDDVDMMGANILGRFRHQLSDTSHMTLKVYFDHMQRDCHLYGEQRDTIDLDFQHNLQLNDQHHLIWGLGYRYSTDDFKNTQLMRLDPEQRSDHLFSGFIQDEITLVENRLKAVVGTKLEHNDYTGFEYQPSGRLLWTPDERTTLWGAVSRAVQTPGRVHHNYSLDMAFFPGGPTGRTLVTLQGNEDLVSQELTAFEMGCRRQLAESVLFDITGYFNSYDNVYGSEPRTPYMDPGPPPTMVMPYQVDNSFVGEVFGGEVTGTWEVTPDWTLKGSYSFSRATMHYRTGSQAELTSQLIEDAAPQHQCGLTSLIDLPGGFEFDMHAYYVDSLSVYDTPSYIRCDARIGWHINDQTTLEVVGQNLFDPGHTEFGVAEGIQPTESERAVYAKLTIRF